MLGVYSSDSYDERAEVNGVDKVLVVELKRGGFEITRKEKQQAQDYASELRKSGKVQYDTTIMVLVLGTTVAPDAGTEIEEGKTRVIAHAYSTILHAAHARTFRLLEKIRQAKSAQLTDEVVEGVVNAKEQPHLFD